MPRYAGMFWSDLARSEMHKFSAIHLYKFYLQAEIDDFTVIESNEPGRIFIVTRKNPQNKKMGGNDGI